MLDLFGYVEVQCVGAEFQNVPGIDSILCVKEIEN
jgi:hypothetical protein